MRSLRSIRKSGLKNVRQPEGSKCCGQAVVATLLGLTLEESIERFGSRAATNWPDLYRVLHWTVEVPKKLTRCTDLRKVPARAILVVKYGKHPTRGYECSHWLLKYGSRIYDPEGIVKNWGGGLIIPHVTSFAKIDYNPITDYEIRYCHSLLSSS